MAGATKVYVVWEDNHGDVTYWSTEELAKRECERIVDEMYDGDRSLMGGPVGYDEHELDAWSFVDGAVNEEARHLQA